MAASTRSIGAHCLCGNAQHTLALLETQLPLPAYICSCTSCRHLTGNLCLLMVFLDQEWTPQQDLLDTVVTYDFSKRIKQYHCGTCGTIMFARVLPHDTSRNGRPVYAVTTGTLTEAEGIFKVAGFEHIEDTLDGGISVFLPSINGQQIERWPGEFRHGTQIAAGWRSPLVNTVKPTPKDTLHAHCKCGGTNFWIARPSARSLQGKAPVPDVLAATVQGSEPHPNPAREGTAWWLCEDRTKFLTGLCSCDSCRLDSGMEWVQWAFVPIVDISLDPGGEFPFMHRSFGTLKVYESSKGVKRYHCAVCGASVFWDGRAGESIIDVAVGLLDAPEGARAENWLHWQSGRLSFREDALKRAESLTTSIEAGLEDYGKQRKGEGLRDEPRWRDLCI